MLAHRAPDQAGKGQNDRLTFTFVTDGSERAITQVKAAASDNLVTVVAGASTIRQSLEAGLVVELHIDLRADLLGDGLRLFEGQEPRRTSWKRSG